MAKTDLLAVAFTDLNGNHKYNSGKDMLIAALVDTNKDGIPSVGDTVQFGAYPAIPDGSASGIGGNFTILESTVTNVPEASSTRVLVNTALGNVIWDAGPSVEFFETTSSSAVIESIVSDNININPPPHLMDQILTVPTAEGPGEPNTSVANQTFQLGNQGFLDVLLFF
jgi:hypothetical protein